MDSPIPEKVTVTLDRERELKYPIPAIWKFEDLTGLDVLNGVKDEEEFYGGTKEHPATLRQRFNRIVDLLWCGLITDDPTITREFVAQHVYVRDISLLDEKVGKAFFESLVPKQEGEKVDPLAPAKEAVIG